MRITPRILCSRRSLLILLGPILTLALTIQPIFAGNNDSPQSSAAEITRLLNEANEFWLKADASNGIPKYEYLLREIEKTSGKDSAQVGLVLFRIGFLYQIKGENEKAVSNFQRSVKLVGPLPDNNDNLTTKANLYWGLGVSYTSLLKLDKANEAFQESLKLKTKLLGPEDPGLVKLLLTIADLDDRQNRPLDAIPRLERALAISERKFGPESVETARVLASLGNIKGYAGQFDAALACLKRSLQISEKILPPTDSNIAAALHNLGSLYAGRGDYQQALPYLERGVELRQKSYRPEDAKSALQFANALNNLGIAQLNGESFDKGIVTLQRSLSVVESAFGSASINLASTLTAVGAAYRRHGNFDHAQKFYKRALRILDEAPAYMSRERVDAMNNFAEMLLDMGDDASALKLYKQSVELAENQLGANDVSVAYGLNGLGRIRQRHGDAAEALTFFERSLVILKGKFGESHRDVAGVLNNIATALEDTGDAKRASATFQQLLAIQEKILPPMDPDIAVTLNNLAVSSAKRGDLVEAQSLIRKSLAIYDAALGRDNKDSCTRLEILGILELLSRDTPKALGEFVESARRWRHYLASQAILQESLGAPQIQDRIQFNDFFQSVCGIAQNEFPQAASSAGAEQLAFSKALLEEVETVRAQLAADRQVEVQALREKADLIRRRLESLAHLEGMSWLRERMDWRNSERDKLEHDLAAIEANIAAANELVARTVRERDLSLTDIARSLPPNSVLVDLVQYRRTDFTAGNNQWKEQRYAAYLTFPLGNDSTNATVERVDLGEAKPIDEALGIIIKRFSAVPPQYRAQDVQPALQRLSDLVYTPLAQHLTNISHLIICPDGQLSRLPFEMLPVGNKFLVEEKIISYVTSGREVARVAANQSKPKPSTQTGKPLVMGNPDFDFDLATATRSIGIGKNSTETSALRSLSRDCHGLNFKPLPNAEAEARSVAKLLGGESELRLGADAREADLKAVQSPQVLHLATHAFFLSDQQFKQINSAGWNLAFAEPGPDRARTSSDWENPMVRCGVALAGANHAREITNATAEDGLLTGLEASLLNLQGTELVILSACDSGSGEVKIGEGIMSLRRAFRIAGAQTVLASHWAVSDKATSELMTEFMRRWRAGESRANAWREAQLTLLRSTDFSKPFFWAAFTLTGQW